MSAISYLTINLKAQRGCPTYNKTDMLCASLDGESCQSFFNYQQMHKRIVFKGVLKFTLNLK
jgi:hypothetical protein